MIQLEHNLRIMNECRYTKYTRMECLLLLLLYLITVVEPTLSTALGQQKFGQQYGNLDS